MATAKVELERDALGSAWRELLDGLVRCVEFMEKKAPMCPKCRHVVMATLSDPMAAVAAGLEKTKDRT